MIKKITAAIVAAACASVIVTLAPGLAPEVAAHASPPTDQSVSIIAHMNKLMEVTVPNIADTRKAVEQSNRNGSSVDTSACEQSWPYYGQSCLLEGNQTAGTGRVVRVIDLGRSAALATYDTGRKSQTRTR
jgi:lipoprotein-anchoring transpeptidase ErfK/SrfK